MAEAETGRHPLHDATSADELRVMVTQMVRDAVSAMAPATAAPSIRMAEEARAAEAAQEEHHAVEQHAVTTAGSSLIGGGEPANAQASPMLRWGASGSAGSPGMQAASELGVDFTIPLATRHAIISHRFVDLATLLIPADSEEPATFQLPSTAGSGLNARSGRSNHSQPGPRHSCDLPGCTWKATLPTPAA